MAFGDSPAEHWAPPFGAETVSKAHFPVVTHYLQRTEHIALTLYRMGTIMVACGRW